MSIVEEFIKFIEENNKHLYSPVHNFTVLIGSLGWDTKNYTGKYYDEHGPEIILNIGKKDSGIRYSSIENFRIPAKEMFVKYLTGVDNAEGNLSECDKNSKKVQSLYNKLTPDYIDSLGEGELINSLEEIIEPFLYTNAAGWFSIYFEGELIDDVLDTVGYKLSPVRVAEILEKATEPVYVSFDERNKNNILSFIASGKSMAEVAVSAQYIFAGFFGCQNLDLVEKQLTEEYGDLSSKEAGDALSKRLNEQREAKSNFDKWIDSLNGEEKTFAEYVQLVTRLRDELRDNIGWGVAILERIGVRLLDIAGLEHKLLHHCLYSDLLKGSDHLVSISGDLKNRYGEGGGVLIAYDRSISSEVLDFDMVEEKMKSVFYKAHGIDINSEVKEIKGQVASKGLAQGRVKVVKNIQSEASKMNEGDVLVTGMTRPEFVPLMKKASAIVTDEGGITSHAAIVSRELGKPCIIGTKVATQVLKDGDEVEVDADNGIVRLLKN